MSPDAAHSEIEVILEAGRDAECQRSNPLRFRVQDGETGRPITGLKPRLRYHRAVDDFTLQRSNSTEEAGGVYVFPFRPSVRGACALLFAAELDGRDIMEVFALEVAPTRATATVGGATYRVAAEWIPPHIHSEPTAEVRLTFEVERATDGGYRPVRATEASVLVTSAERGVRETLSAAATGPGTFEAWRRFTIDEVGPNDTSYEVSLSFTDPENGARVPERAVTFPLAAGPAH